MFPCYSLIRFVIFGFVCLLLQAISQAIKYFAVMVGHEEILEQIRQDEAPEVKAVIDEVSDRAKTIITS